MQTLLPGKTIALLTLICIVVLTVAAPNSYSGQNVWTGHGPEGGTVGVLAIHPLSPGALYAGGTGNTGMLFKTTNQGSQWAPIANGSITSLAVDPLQPDTVYFGTYQGAGFKSTNGGADWTPLTGCFGRGDVVFPDPVRALAVDPRNPRVVYAGKAAYWGGSLCKSLDGGASWNRISQGLNGSQVSALAIDPANTSQVYAGTVAGVFKTDDGGTTWKAFNTGLGNNGVRTLAIDPSNTSKIYAGTLSGLFKSSDAGATWSPVGGLLSGGEIYALAVDPSSPESIYVGTDGNGVLKSIDGGLNWNPVNSGLTDTSIQSLAVDPRNPATVYAGTMDDGVFMTTDDGGRWQARNTGLTAVPVTALAVDSLNPARIYGGASGGRAVYRSDDSGANWLAASEGLPRVSCLGMVAHPWKSGVLYAATASQGVFKTMDGGNHWSARNSGLLDRYFKVAGLQDLAMHPADPEVLYAGSYGEGIFKSTDGGGQWRKVTSNNIVSVYSLAIDPENPEIVYAGSVGVFKSLNGGKEWTSANGGLPSSSTVKTIAISPENTEILYAAVGVGLYKSSNGGESWIRISDSFPVTPDILSLAIDPTYPQTVYAGTRSNGVWRSTNGGVSWNAYRDSLTSLLIKTLALDPKNSSRLYAGTGAGVFSIDFGAPSPVFTRYLPKVASDDQFITGLAVVNRSAGTARIRFMGYDDKGTVQAWAERSMPARSQRALMLSQLLPSWNPASGWLELESSVDELDACSLLMSPDLAGMDGIPFYTKAMKEFTLPASEDAEISLVNPGTAAATFTLQSYDESGLLSAWIEDSIGPKGKVVIPLRRLRQSWMRGGYLRGTSSGVAPVSVFGKQGWTAAFPGLEVPDRGAGSRTVYALQYASGGGFLTRLDLINLEPTPTRLFLTLLDNGGRILATATPITLPPQGSAQVSSLNAFGNSNAGILVQGYVRIESDGGRFTGAVRFSDAQEQQFGTAASLVSEGHILTSFAQAAENDGYYTGLAIVNPHSQVVDVNVTVFDTAGKILSAGNRRIPPRGRVVGLLVELVGPLPLTNQGYIEVRAALPVLSLALFGPRMGNALAALLPIAP